MSNITFYATITDKILDNLNYRSTQYEISYMNEQDGNIEIINIADRDNDYKIIIDDAKSNWTPKDNLILEKKLYFYNTKILFGTEGIANQGSIIGVGVICKSPESNQKIIKKIGSLNDQKQNFEIDMEFVLEASTFRGIVNLEIVLYLEKASISSNLLSHLSNIQGTQLGVIESTQIILEGDGSQFPIFMVEDPKSPLWEVVFSFSSCEDSFASTVKLKLNSSHKNYRYINQFDKKYFCEPLLDEIISNVVALFIIKCVEINIYDDASPNDVLAGSVGHLISYYKDLYAPINTSSSEEIFSSISKGIRSHPARLKKF